jgi:hypothetical protein
MGWVITFAIAHNLGPSVEFSCETSGTYYMELWSPAMNICEYSISVLIDGF